MKYLSAEDILVMHARVIEETGGAHGVRDIGLLASAVQRPRTAFGGKEMYPGVFEKAAIYLESFVRYHVFVDGNKRTGAIAAARFLYLNGYELSATNKELERFVLKATVKRLDIKTIAGWLKSHTEK